MARLAYRLDLGASMYVPELDEALDAWVCGTLWNAVWDPGIMTMAEARAARRWLDRMGRMNTNPAADYLPYDIWDTPAEFALRTAPPCYAASDCRSRTWTASRSLA